MRGHPVTQKGRANVRRAFKDYYEKALASSKAKSRIVVAKRRAAYKNVTLPTINLPPERET